MRIEKYHPFGNSYCKRPSKFYNGDNNNIA
jgi:hypothetical protein